MNICTLKKEKKKKKRECECVSLCVCLCVTCHVPSIDLVSIIYSY